MPSMCVCCHLCLFLQRSWPPSRRAMWMKWPRGGCTSNRRNLELSGTSTLRRMQRRSESCSARSASSRFLLALWLWSCIVIGCTCKIFKPQTQGPLLICIKRNGCSVEGGPHSFLWKLLSGLIWLLSVTLIFQRASASLAFSLTVAPICYGFGLIHMNRGRKITWFILKINTMGMPLWAHSFGFKVWRSSSGVGWPHVSHCNTQTKMW